MFIWSVLNDISEGDCDVFMQNLECSQIEMTHADFNTNADRRPTAYE